MYELDRLREREVDDTRLRQRGHGKRRKVEKVKQGGKRKVEKEDDKEKTRE